MILLVHILIALSSVGVATLAFFKPTNARLYTSYGLIAATLASGTFLILTLSTNILKSCLTGLVYVTIVSAITVATHVRVKKLAAEKV